MKKTILFISHDASRSGAPLLLKNIIYWLKEMGFVEPIILCINGGELEEEFSRLGRTYVWNGYHKSNNIFSRVQGYFSKKKKVKSHRDKITKSIVELKPKLVYANTVVSNEIAFYFKSKLNCLFLSHIHEMRFSAYHFYKTSLSIDYLNTFNHFIVVNEFIQQFLIKDFNINNESVDIIPPFYQVTSSRPFSKTRGASCKYKIGFSGFGGWQKGIDLLVPLIRSLSSLINLKDIEFVWIGNVENEVVEKIKFDLEQSEIDCNLNFTGYIKNPSSIVQELYLFVSLSREDSFPTICLEAASFKIPILCFERSGGIIRFVSNDAGLVVPYMDVFKMAQSIVWLLQNEDERMRRGLVAHSKVQFYSKEQIMPQIYAAIEKLLK